MKLAKLNSRNRHAGPKPAPEPLRLDFGCGPNKRQGFKGVDSISFPGVDVMIDLMRIKRVITECDILGYKQSDIDKARVGEFIPWPWKNDSVEEAHASHVIEHFNPMERVHFMNELYRILKPGGKCTVIVPHWASCRAYGDPTHQWPPVSEFYWFYLKKEWRMSQAPHTDASNLPWGLTCNFEVVGGYNLNPAVAARNQEYQQFAIDHYKEAAMDTIATLTKLPCPTQPL